ncbi:hypothetical protein CVU75_00925 [Candidatus Dependentiae bacterium HGW-Dependentiae-1]|nr:MAG: hypothetical protein CVU75_00925 [Candidatus Dependentiae bacterium HGW-Dependentiae-1]
MSSSPFLTKNHIFIDETHEKPPLFCLRFQNLTKKDDSPPDRSEFFFAFYQKKRKKYRMSGEKISH